MQTQHMIFNLRGIVLQKFPKLLVQKTEIEGFSSFTFLGVSFGKY